MAVSKVIQWTTPHDLKVVHCPFISGGIVEDLEVGKIRL